MGIIQIAIKTELGVFYFNQPAWAYTGFSEDGKLDEQTFLGQWRAIPTVRRAVNWSVDER